MKFPWLTWKRHHELVADLVFQNVVAATDVARLNMDLRDARARNAVLRTELDAIRPAAKVEAIRPGVKKGKK
jgi:hypothetical protein